MASSLLARRDQFVYALLQVALRRTVLRRGYEEDTEEVAEMVYEFPNPQFIEDCKKDFPEKMIANAEEARVSGAQRTGTLPRWTEAAASTGRSQRQLTSLQTL
jgi:hypothetical protein